MAALHIDAGIDQFLRVTVSVGSASLIAGETGSEMLHRSDEALYDAKRGGRDCVRLAA